MQKYTFANSEKTRIQHNLAPSMLINVLKLDAPNDYQSQNLGFDDIFDEIFIRGWHFVFLLEKGDIDEDNDDDIRLTRSILQRAGRWYKSQVVSGFIPLDKFVYEGSYFEDEDFKLVKSDKPNWWLVADKSTNVIIEFEHSKFNETQKISELSPIDSSDFMLITNSLRTIGEWLSIYHQDKIQ